MPNDKDFGSDLPEFAEDINFDAEQFSPAAPASPKSESSSPKPQTAGNEIRPKARVNPTTPSVPQLAALAKPPKPVSTTGSVPVADQNVIADDSEPSFRRSWLTTVPSWAISLALHTAILVAMAAYTVEPISKALTKLVIDSGAPSEDLAEDSFDLETASLDDAELTEQSEMAESVIAPTQEMTMDVPMEVTVATMEVGSLANLPSDSLSSQFVPSNLSSASGGGITQGLTSRAAASKRDLLEKFGGGDDTEKAVAMGLKWLAEHQMPDGSWSFAHSLVCNGQCKEMGNFVDARNAATGIALMAFLGAGQTHVDGDYKDRVFQGLSFLLGSMQRNTFGGVNMGTWYNDPGPLQAGNGRNPSLIYRMYGHAIATTAICEAYGMTKDPKLAEAAQLAVNYIVAAQDPRGGGWRYEFRQAGDTSVVGWQMMALKSALMSNIQFPEETIRRVSHFLDTVATDNGTTYHYERPGDRAGESSLPMTACAMLCRMYMGMPKNHPALLEALGKLQQANLNNHDAYLLYYTTQVMKHSGGTHWKDWNEKMKKQLVSSQINTGHAMGSWTPRVGHDVDGGRLYTTAMSIMVLEVYYRYLPIYHEQSEDEAFKL